MLIELDTPQRLEVVIEKNKSDTWSVVAYLITADGKRERHSLGMSETYKEAAQAIKKAWQRIIL